jgi:hypothetical protein
MPSWQSLFRRINGLFKVLEGDVPTLIGAKPVPALHPG